MNCPTCDRDMSFRGVHAANHHSMWWCPHCGTTREAGTTRPLIVDAARAVVRRYNSLPVGSNDLESLIRELEKLTCQTNRT